MNFYNEHDQKAAAWLGELVKQNQLPSGRIDTRDIRDIRTGDLHGFAQAHFFAGIGGWPLALELAGYDGPCWTGSCPCQPFSVAGKGKAEADGRHLWPEFRRLIAECRPPIIFGEQVASRLGRQWLSRVRLDLEALGYAVGCADLCAAGVWAPHIRQRLYWVAVRVADAEDGTRKRTIGRSLERVDTGRLGEAGRLADAAGGQRQQLMGSQRDAVQRSSDDGADGGMADALSTGRPEGRPKPRGGSVAIGGSFGGMAHRVEPGLEGLTRHGDHGHQPGRDGAESTGSDAKGGDVGGLGNDMPGRSDATDSFWRDADWLFCRDGKWRRVEPGSFPLAHGVPARVGRLRGYGNAIVPQVAATFVRSFMEAAQ